MAEVYDPSNPYGSSGIEDPSNTGATLDWWTAQSLGLVNPWTTQDPVDPSDPFSVYDARGIGPITPWDPDYNDPNMNMGGGYNGTGFPSGHGSLGPNNPTQYPGSQFPNIGIGIPGLIGIGAGGLMTGGLWDILGGSSGGGGGGGGQSGQGPIFPPVSGGGGATVGPGMGGQEQTPTNGQVWPLPGVYSDSGATVGPGLGGQEQSPQNGTIWPLPGPYESSNATVGPDAGGDARPGDGTITTPPITGSGGDSPNEPKKPNMIVPALPGPYTDSGLTVIPGGGGGGGDFGQPSQLPTQQVTMDQPLNRNYYNEGRQGLIDLNALMPYMASLYGRTSDEYLNKDFSRYSGLLSGGTTGQLGAQNKNLSEIASAQTAYANEQLRKSNLQDVGNNWLTALGYRKDANTELYSNLNRLDAAAGQQAGGAGSNFLNSLLGQGGLQPSSIQTTLEGQAAAGLAQGRGLSAEDTRMAQQAAREGSAARGRLYDQSSVAAEVLNRDALGRQRENERRAFAQSVDQAGFGQRAAGLQGNIGLGQAVGGMDLARQQQSFNQLLGATQARTANAFDPFGTILGAQYGMQTSNVGNNQQLFNNATGFSSGAYGNQYVQNAFNPYNNYSADVYGSNFNAANARQIAANTSGAYSDAARNNLYSQILGGAINYLLPQLGPNVNKPTGGTGTGKG